MDNIFSSELIGFGIEFIVDSMINFVRALMWPVYAVQWWPPVGVIALVAAFVVFPRTLKAPIERWLFRDADSKR
jgi:hypothetical protein